MAIGNDRTTLVCLFHHAGQADGVLKDLAGAGVPESSISVIGRDEDGAAARTASGSYSTATLEELGVPERDRRHLMGGVKDGGVLVAVRAITDHVDAVEEVFRRHSATKIDEAVTDIAEPALTAAPLAAAAAIEPVSATSGVIPMIEEDLVVGKRTVDQGGVRLYRRVVEIPVDTDVSLREEHVRVERKAVDRPLSDGDLAFQDRTIELTETAEEAVIGKTARVVEEVHVGKLASERTEHIHDTVRQTEVEIEAITPELDARDAELTRRGGAPDRSL